MNNPSNNLTLDLQSNLQNITFQEFLNKLLSIPKGQLSNTIFTYGNERICLNITKLPLLSQEMINNPDNKAENNDLSNNINISNNLEKELKKIETLENSDSLVRHISDKEDTKTFLGLSNFPNLLKCETYPLNNIQKTVRNESRHFSMDAANNMLPIDKKPLAMIKSFSQKVLKENEVFLKKCPINFENENPRRFSNDIDFSLSISKDSFSAQRLTMKRQETSLNNTNSLNMKKAMSFNNKYNMVAEDNELYGDHKKIDNIIPLNQTNHESFNTLDFNVSKSDSKSGSPLKKANAIEPLNINKFITIENQGNFNDYALQPLNAKSGENSVLLHSMDLDHLELAKSLYITDNSNSLDQKNLDNINNNTNNIENKDRHSSSSIGMNKINDLGGSANKRYTNNKNMTESHSYSNISDSLEGISKKISFDNEDKDKMTSPLAIVEDLLKKTDKKSKNYQDLLKTYTYLKSLHEKLVDKETELNNKIEEVSGYERTLKEKEKKLNELLEKTSKSSTQWSLDTVSNSNNQQKDPLKELLEETMSETGKKTIIPSDAEIHFLFLYSSPLITYFKDSGGKIGKRPICNEIDYLNELKNVQDILLSSGREIKFMSVPATLEKLSMSLDKNPLALHFCGHGVRNNEETFGINYDEKEGDFLILEDEVGAAYFMSSKNLEKLLTKLKNQLYFVFVASCHSKIVGEVFQKAGALHVICVKREERILDSACQIFSKAFYNACLTGKKTICEAFMIAKDQVRLNETIPPGEENKLVLLRKDEDDIYSEHICTGWVDAGPGSFIDLNEKPEFNQLPSRIENFMGRNEVMHDLISLILTSRFVTLKGIAGIGKSSLVKETLRYIYDRKHFKNGVIYINLNGCETREAVTSCLNARMFGSYQHIESRKENGGKMVQQIVEHLRNKEVLIVFDNVMDLMLVNEKERFQLFIDLLLSNCNDIKILITSRTPLGDGPLADYAEKIINLGPLSDEDSKNLLLARAPRPISDEEIEELLNMDLDMTYNQNGSTNEKKKEFVKHAFFDLFGGHPQAIVLAASLFDEKTLKEVFLHLKENSVINAYDYGSELSERDKKSFNSLRWSLDISWESLVRKYKSAAQLLAFFGLFPAGIQEEDLAVIWKENYKSDCEILLRSSFLRKIQKENTIHYSLFPFMAKYAEERLTATEKRDYHEKILLYFSKTIEEFYKIIGTISKEAEKCLNILIRYELNIRACIFREITYQGNDDLEKSLYDSFNLNTSNIIIKERFKDIEAIKEDDEDEFFPLTKTNIEMHQKRFDTHKSSLRHNQSLSGNSLRSSSPIYITESMANQLKTPRARDNISQSDNYMFKAFNFNSSVLNQSGVASASLENSNTIEFNENIARYSITPEPDSTGGDIFKKLKPFTPKTEVSLNTDQMVTMEKENINNPPKKTPKFYNEIEETDEKDEKMTNEQSLQKINNELNQYEEVEKDKSKNYSILHKDSNFSNFDNNTNNNSECPQILILEDNSNNNMCSKNPHIPGIKNKKSVKINLSGSFEKSDSLKIPHPIKPPINEISARISQSKCNVNSSQEIFTNLKNDSTQHHYRMRSGGVKNNLKSPPHPGQVLPINRLIIYYASILFLLRRYVESIKMLKYGLKIAKNGSDVLAEANYYRIFGVVSHLRKQYGKSVDDFGRARDLFQKVGCSVGVAICEAAMGYIKFSENCELFKAKEHLEKSLKIYESLQHSFGIYFLNRWLGILKQKIPHLKHETKIHFQLANKIKEIKKAECLISNHKGGFFVLRWMGDPISLLLETPLTVLDFQEKFKKKNTNTNENKYKNKRSIINLKKSDDVSDEIKSISKTLQVKIDDSVDLENNSLGLDDSSNKAKTINSSCNFLPETDEIINVPNNHSLEKKSATQRKPPQIPKQIQTVGRNSMPAKQNSEK